LNPLIKSEGGADSKPLQRNVLRLRGGPSARRVVIKPPELGRVLAAWPTLPEHLKQAILAIVSTAPPAADSAG
jgi:hypothetical protein